MSRFALPALLLMIATPALAAGDAAENCRATAGIVAEAVALRADGKVQDDTVKALKAGDIDDRLLPTVGPLVGWVYTLPKAQLGDEAPTAFEAACLKQAG